MQDFQLPPARITPLQKKLYQLRKVEVDVLRLDELHPFISGNKWFKLKAYLREAAEQGKGVILTFGGTFSNHIGATAAACRLCGFRSVGIIRGERAKVLSPLLQEAQEAGMALHFISRTAYREKAVPEAAFSATGKEDVYVIAEGGYGPKGAEGARDMVPKGAGAAYTHLLAAVGTGTSLAGLAGAALPHQQVIGVSSMKNNYELEAAVARLLPRPAPYTILHDFHFGGYAKHTEALTDFMNACYAQTGVPTDFVYTAKLFFAADHLIEAGYFPPGSRLLLVHSGGLQGNRSLPKGTLIF